MAAAAAASAASEASRFPQNRYKRALRALDVCSAYIILCARRRLYDFSLIAVDTRKGYAEDRGTGKNK